MANIHLTNFTGPQLRILQHPILHCMGCCSNIVGYNRSPHSHAEIELMYIVKGEGITKVNHKEYPLMPGTLVVYEPNIIHQETFKTNAPTPVFYHIKFDELSVAGLPTNHLLPKDFSVTIEAKEYQQLCQNLFSTMFLEARKEEIGYIQVLDSLLRTIILLTLRIVSLNQPSLSMAESEDSLISQIQYYLSQNFNQKISMEAVADKFFISSYYLSHLFKNKIGIPPTVYITQIRINRACRYLNQTDMTIADIAFAVGYPSQSNFQTQFKKYKGISPSQYRNHYKTSSIIYMHKYDD